MGEESSVVPGKCLEVAVFPFQSRGALLLSCGDYRLSWSFQCHREASNLGLNYLCKLAGCTFNVQPANLHNFFQRKARHVTLNAFQSFKIP